jgi:hypothetical protein
VLSPAQLDDVAHEYDLSLGISLPVVPVGEVGGEGGGGMRELGMGEDWVWYSGGRVGAGGRG